MTRQERLESIGNMHLNEYVLKVIIPCPHNFYKNKKSIFNTVKKLEWNILNATGNKELEAHNIKSNIYNNMIPKYDDTKEKEFLLNNNTLLLQKKINQEFIYKDIKFNVEFLDLWIFDEHVSFFVLNIKLNDFTKYTINELSEFHQLLKNFKFSKIVKKNSICILSSNGYVESFDFLKLLLSYTEIEGKTFLNISINECANLFINNKLNSLYSIYNGSTNAKLLVGMETKNTFFENKKDIEDQEEENLSFLNTKELSTLSELPFYIASCSSLNPKKNWTSDDGYIYSCVEKNGFNIWKYSSGIVLHDSAAFVGLNKDGGNIVSNVNHVFYFIYILNLYIYTQTRFIEFQINDEKKFETLEINNWYQKLQKLKNKFAVEDIAVKFQENELHMVMMKSLKTKEILTEVTQNLINTKEIAESNMTIYFTILTFLFATFFKEQLLSIISNFKILIVPLLIIIFLLAYKYRRLIKKIIKI